MNKELLLKYLKTNYTSKELDDVIDWIKVDAIGISGNLLMREIWENFEDDGNAFGHDKKNYLLYKIHHSINMDAAMQPKPKSRKLAIIYKYMVRAAAILFIPVLSLLLHMYANNNLHNKALSKTTLNEIISPIGSRTFVELPDGTGVWLNHGSKLIYPQFFSGKTRNVQLEGEAHFDVAHNSKVPFVVKTENFNVKAVGTKFNVNAYPRESFEETTLVEGVVIIQTKSDGKKEIDLLKMQPGQNFYFDEKTREYSCKYTDTEKHVSWIDGVLIFKDDPIEKIVKKLDRWYNVDITFTSEKVKSFPYTATFVDETLLQILDLLEIATPITYKIYPREKLPDGKFSKMRVEIGIKKEYN